ncbi:DUF4292 domain-containing protein [Pararcticibacter amylolyticus]|uniref:DUF4292 domain-containing protein n=1 Tax=Pararcticibacter amylolyticus TaxID=2173175 RepID=A0A2U2PHY4_9SPHI|nr:DUF4292 domain-containing protein [Pararcticibacter amylolyticus]PWG81001.1 DUF4292 domain-containing protein [Pararcticibacter amylolyticus]
MKKNIINNILIAGIIVITGCKARKESAQASPAVTTLPTTEKAASASGALIKNISSGQFDFKTLSAKAKAELSIGNNNNDVNMNIRVKKDEVIWISLTAIAGIEVARAMITPDSIKVLNKIQGIYLAKPFSYIYRYANRQINFTALQSLLIGNPLPGTVSPDAEVTLLADNKQLQGDASGLIYSMTFNIENKLIDNKLKDKTSNQSVQAEYSDFQNISNMKIPATVKIKSMAQDKPVRLQLKYNSVTANEPLEFPFSVPKRYEVAN